MTRMVSSPVQLMLFNHTTGSWWLTTELAARTTALLLGGEDVWNGFFSLAHNDDF